MNGFDKRLKEDGFSIKVENPYLDLYIKELDSDLEDLIKRFALTYIDGNSKAKARASTRWTLQEYLYYYEATKQSENNCHLVSNIDKRGKEFSLDHIVPLSYGFRYQVPIEIISSVDNLRIIPSKFNQQKGAKITNEVEIKIKELGIIPSHVNFHPYEYQYNEYSGTRFKHRVLEKKDNNLRYYNTNMDLLHIEPL